MKPCTNQIVNEQMHQVTYDLFQNISTTFLTECQSSAVHQITKSND